MRHRFVKANRFWLAVLDATGCDGLTMPWRTIYMRPDCFHDTRLRAHELAHIGQIERLGPVWFSVVYIYQLCRYGYDDMPLEREARIEELVSQLDMFN